MMKICPRCAGTFAGGAFCPGCGVGQPLIDMSSEAARPLLGNPDMQLAVQSHYAERSGMVRSTIGTLVGVLGGVFLLRFAVGADGPVRSAAWTLVALGWGTFFVRGSVRQARRMAKLGNAGTPAYVCVDEDEPVEKFRPPPRRGLRWLTW